VKDLLSLAFDHDQKASREWAIPSFTFEVNTSRGCELARFCSTAFAWEAQVDGDDYFQISTRGVCAGTGAPGIDGGIGPSEPARTSSLSMFRYRTSGTRFGPFSSLEVTSRCQ
jgi:hypothetical protein